MHQISELLCLIYKELHKNGQVSFPLSEKHKKAIDSVVKTVNASYFNIERYPGNRAKAAAYLFFLIKDHPLTDGNKRMAVFWFSVFCVTNNLERRDLELGLDELAVAVEKSQLPHTELINLLVQILFTED